MIHCIFTIDYEIYGSGEGSLKELVYEPSEKLITAFRNFQIPLVVFVEVAELEMIEKKGTDSAIELVKHQIRNFYNEGIELGLHIHPQWYKASYEGERWRLDYNEYNLCTLSRDRIIQIIDRAISYFRNVLGVAQFTPFSFRGGNWLIQPAKTIAEVLAERGIKVDSSVFKGGLRHEQKLNYRRALKNGYFWRFTDDAEIPTLNGDLLEVPIYTQMVPFWRMLNTKRISLESQGFSSAKSAKSNLFRLLDFLRFWHPLKLDFSRMKIDELTSMVDKVTQDDRQDPSSFKPLVAIGHTKDLVDFETVEYFLSYLEKKKIPVSTFEDVYERCI